MAVDENGVISMLRQSGYYPVDITLVGANVTRVTTKKIGIKAMAGFCQQVASMLRAGVPIAKTFEILKDQSEDKGLRKILDDIFIKIQKGSSLTESFAAYQENFPAVFLNMIEAGEAAGTLDLCMDRAGQTFLRSAKLAGKVKAAMAYPIVIFSLMMLIVIAMLLFVIPTFVTLFEQNNTDLPFLTQLLVDLSSFVQSHWMGILFFIAIIAILVNLFLHTNTGRTALDELKLHLPIVSKLLIKIYAARYSRTLASLNAAGVSLPKALDVTARSIGNYQIEKSLYDVREAINRGERLSDNLRKMDIMPPMLVYLTHLGEESGTLDTLLVQAADFYDEESDSALQVLTSLMEPLMILLMAALLLPVLLAIILPVFGMYSLIG